MVDDSLSHVQGNTDEVGDVPRRWITDTPTSERFPHYTRANADEVAPYPISPLGWDLAWNQGASPGVADGYVRFGIAARDEFRWPVPETFGNWGGYFYNQLSLGRLLGVRMPGASAQAIDRAYFGENPNVPPYAADSRDENEEQTAKLVATMTEVLASGGYQPLEEFVSQTRSLAGKRPDLHTLSDADLVAYVRTFPAIIRYTWDVYAYVVIGASIGPGAVQAVCEGLGRGGDVAALFSGLGGVESASSSMAFWDLSRIVRASAELTAAFDSGLSGLNERIFSLPQDVAGEFCTSFDALLELFGHRGPHEWDLASLSWAMDPRIPLGIVERLRLRSDDADPHVRAVGAAAERERLSTELLGLTQADDEAHATLRAGLRSGKAYYQLREAGKDAAVRVMNEAKLPIRELGRRLAERGDIETAGQVFQLLDAELDQLVLDAQPIRELVGTRARVFARLGELEPPYVISHPQAPPVTSWQPRARTGGRPVADGEVLQGIGVSPGVATGVARIVHDMARADRLQPGDILVCATTDPSWVPLFLTAGAVVCNVGALASHAAIASRELGVPCAVSVAEATSRILDGQTISVDGGSGTVTIITAVD